MLEDCKDAQERWGGVSDIVDKWLGERQNLLIDYCKLSEDVQFDDEDSALGLRQLCEKLVDYVSAGHFEIYDQLIREAEDFRDSEGLQRADDFYKKIDTTTEYILDFNDKYDETDDLDAIENDLSTLGEVLAARFEAEDNMIEILHLAHHRESAPSE